MDEFSDFQMAIQKPPNSNISNGRLSYYGAPVVNNQQLRQPNPRFPPDSSPVHGRSLENNSHSGFPMKSQPVLFSQQFRNPLRPAAAPPPPISNPPTTKTSHPIGFNIGSRLANYDLGLSIAGVTAAAPPPIQIQSNNLQPNLPLCNPLKITSHSNTKPPDKSQDLLIGEEDKYSALRLLLEAESNTGSIFGTSSGDEANPTMERPLNTTLINNYSDSNLINSVATTTSTITTKAIPVTNSTYTIMNTQPTPNCVSAFEFSTDNFKSSLAVGGGGGGEFGDSSSDFGDFQSFTGFATETEVIKPNSIQPSLPPTNFDLSSDSFSHNYNNFTSSAVSTLPFPTNQLTSQLPTLPPMLSLQQQQLQNFIPEPVHTPTLTTLNLTKDCDSEFGDFVSVEPIPAPKPSSSCISTKPPNNNNNDLQSHQKLEPNYLDLLSMSPPSPSSHLQISTFQTESSDVGKTAATATLAAKVEDDFSFQQFKSETFSPPPLPLQTSSASFFSANRTVAITENNISIISSDIMTAQRQQQQNDIFEKDDNDSFIKSPSNTTGLVTETLKPQKYNFSHQQTSTAAAIPSSTFIRTSLIRNDEVVTDVDSIRWTQSVEKSCNEGAMDYIISSYDGGNKEEGGKTKFLDVSPETRSIASLDLGNYVSVDYPENTTTNFSNNNNNINNNNGKPFLDQSVMQPNSNQSSEKCSLSFNYLNDESPPEATNTTLYDDYDDKYQYLRDEWENERERYFTEWDRCLTSFTLILSKALLTFKNASTQEVIREVVDNEKGYLYVMNILEIYHIFLGIHKSSVRIGLDAKLRSKHLEVNNLWESLTSTLTGTCVSDDISQETNRNCSPPPPLPTQHHRLSEERDGLSSFCGVCLCPVDISENSQYLDYGGKTYHCNCANFWVNEVDAILPSLLSYNFPSTASPQEDDIRRSSNSSSSNSR